MPTPFPGLEAEPATLPAASSPESSLSLLTIIALVALGIFILYGIVLSYHWFRYSHRMSTAVLSLALYTIGGAILFGLLFSATAILL